MSETPVSTIEQCIHFTRINSGTDATLKENMLAELARLRAVDEAWRAVRANWQDGNNSRNDAIVEIQRQIARLDQLAKEEK